MIIFEYSTKQKYIMQKLTIPTCNEIKVYFPHIRICLVKVFCVFLYCVIHKNTVNLNICKKTFGQALGQKGIKLSSAYRRLTRFFNMQTPRVFCIGISYMILNLLSASSQGGIYWAIDRTNWQIGDKNKVNCNMLTLGLVLRNGCFIPIIGIPLNKKGNSNEKERIDLINDLVALFFPYLPKALKDKKHILLGDREFIGEKWFTHIIKQGFSLIMRIRKDDYLLALAEAENTTIDKVKRKIARRVKRDGFYHCIIRIRGTAFSFVVLANSNANAKKADKLVRFISDLNDIAQISKAYRQRWQIEVYFKHCKTNGFNLEDLNLTDEGKMLLITAIVGVAYVLAVLQGILKMKQCPVKEQYFPKQDKWYLRESIFKQGLDEIEANVFNLMDLFELIQSLLPQKPSFNKELFVSKLIHEYSNTRKERLKSVQ